MTSNKFKQHNIIIFYFISMMCHGYCLHSIVAFSIVGSNHRYLRSTPRHVNNEIKLFSSKLSSLFDEAILFHSKIDQNEKNEVANLIEEIALAIEMEKKYNIIPHDKVSSVVTLNDRNKRRIEEVGRELDEAVVNLQKVAMGQDDDQKLMNIIENLAQEYHELMGRNNYRNDDVSSLIISSSKQEKESHLIKGLDLFEEKKGFDVHIQKLEEKLHQLKQLDTIDMRTKEINQILIPSDTHKVIIDHPHGEEKTLFESESIPVDDQKLDYLESTVESGPNENNNVNTVVSSVTPQIPSTNESSQINFNQGTEVSTDSNKHTNDEVEEVDIAIIGAGIGGLCAGAILNTLYDKKVGIYESHYLPGGCAHAFPATAVIENGDKKEKISFTFDSGPTIVLGCSTKPYNPLRQVLNAVNLGDEVEWIPYQGWGMIENPSKDEKEIRWQVDLGPDRFQNGPLLEFGGEEAVAEFEQLREVTKVLVSGAVEIPAMAMRAGNSALIPLLRYLPALTGLIQQGEEVTQGTFGQFLDGPKFVVKNKWLRDYLDALAFSLSGLPACRTSAAAMAYVIYDMHREGAALDYPKGGLGAVVDALVQGVEQGSNGSRVNLRQHVESIDSNPNGRYIEGITLKNGKKIIAKDGVICNAPIWSLNKLVKNEETRKVLNDFLPLSGNRTPRQTWVVPNDGNVNKILYKRPEVNDDNSLLAKCDTAEMTGSFLHLHIALDAHGIDLDSMQAHYTVMDRGLAGDGSVTDDYADSACGELNMIAVSNPCVLDRTLAPDGYIVVHAYGAGNEPYDIWKGLDRSSDEYKALKEVRATALWRAVESVIPDVRKRAVMSMIGSPITHERFLRRPRGTYGAATEDYLKDGSTPFQRLVLCGDSIFPGIGIPAVALSGASAANTVISPWQQWKCLDKLKSKGLI